MTPIKADLGSSYKLQYQISKWRIWAPTWQIWALLRWYKERLSEDYFTITASPDAGNMKVTEENDETADGWNGALNVLEGFKQRIEDAKNELEQPDAGNLVDTSKWVVAIFMISFQVSKPFDQRGKIMYVASVCPYVCQYLRLRSV